MSGLLFLLFLIKRLPLSGKDSYYEGGSAAKDWKRALYTRTGPSETTNRPNKQIKAIMTDIMQLEMTTGTLSNYCALPETGNAAQYASGNRTYGECSAPKSQ